MINKISRTVAFSGLLGMFLVAGSASPTAQRTAQPPAANPGTGAVVTSLVPKDYIIGVEDILRIVFWRDNDLTSEVVVRPDGKISVPMLNDVQAAGMTAEQLAVAVQNSAMKFIRDPGVTVMIKEIHS